VRIQQPSTSWRSAGFLALCLLAAAFNLRPALTSLATLLAEIQNGLQISSFWAGILTTMPVLCFGVFGPVAPLVSARLGLERAVFVLLVLLTAGLALRALPLAMALVGSTLLVGAAIGMVSVLLPVFIRRDFPRRLGLTTGFYTMVLSIGGASGAWLTPLFEGQTGAWPVALAAWGAPALAATALWGGLSLTATKASGTARLAPFAILLRDPVAWHVTAFMGLQAALAFIVLGWLPTQLRDRGLDVADAGFVTSVSIIAQTVTALVAPSLATRTVSPRVLILLVLLATVAGFLGLLYAPIGSRLLWGLMMGLGQGGLFGLALLFISLRSPSAEAAAMLSGMSQSIGYLGAALGPFAVSLLRVAFTGPAGTAFLFTATSLLCTWFGLRAARPVFVLERQTWSATSSRASIGEHPR
jgi:CP family cyanate transporter-like MFS transporter